MVDRGHLTEHPKGKTKDGRAVTVCYCGGGPAHEWRPNGGGMRILACPSWAPAPKPVTASWPARWSDPTYLGDGPYGA